MQRASAVNCNQRQSNQISALKLCTTSVFDQIRVTCTSLDLEAVEKQLSVFQLLYAFVRAIQLLFTQYSYVAYLTLDHV